MKPKERCKEGKKYMLVGHIGMFGPELLWADNIKDSRACDLADVSEGKALLLKTRVGPEVILAQSLWRGLLRMATRC